jgi:hypothetical protein
MEAIQAAEQRAERRVIAVEQIAEQRVMEVHKLWSEACRKDELLRLDYGFTSEPSSKHLIRSNYAETRIRTPILLL